MNEFTASSDIRARFCAAMSRMYRTEVPAYGSLIELVADINEATLRDDPALDAELRATDGIDRISDERHGAIRLGTADELATLRRVFAVMGMYPVGYYDLSVAGIPVHSTAFRPVDPDALAANPFRVFTSLLRLELIEDAELRAQAERILAERQIFTDEALRLTALAESQGGLTADEAQAFIGEVLETFRWHPQACVTAKTYQRLHDAHRLIADVVSFRGPHINHLTPRTLDIDAVQRAMPECGIEPKAVIEGPPRRACPILLRQTSFKALDEPVAFRDGAGGWTEGHHTARFGEIEQRGAALTPKGRALYDELLAEARAEVAPAADGSNAEAYVEHLAKVFERFPDDWATLRAQGLAYFHYSLTDAGTAAANGDAGETGASGSPDDTDLDALIDDGRLRFDPIVYEDFLPVSAAGIFQSNLGDAGTGAVAANANRAEFEAALGTGTRDEFAHYADIEARSIDACLARLRPTRPPHRQRGMSEPVSPERSRPAPASGDAHTDAHSADNDRILGPEADLTAYEIGARGESGRAAFVMRPTTTEGVSAAVAGCFRQGIPFVTQSANTGLVGASIPDGSGEQAVLSTERLNTVCRIDVDNRSVRVGAGMRLSRLNALLEPEGLWFPIDLGADPMIGGMVASNTGGARFLRYGDVRANILGLTVVLPDAEGTVLRLDTDLRKNNTGPDWKQLFIGTGGSFGVVTECVLNVEPLPARQATALLVPRSEDAIFELLRQFEHRLGRHLSAFELMSGNAIRHALAHAPALRNPFSGSEIPATALLIEIAESDAPQVDAPPLQALLERALAELWGRPDAPLADALFGPPEEIWPLRHALSEGVKHAGRLFAFDLAFRRPDVITFRSVMRDKLAEDWPELEVCDFGHVADGGLHFNLVCTDPSRCAAEDYERRLRRTVLDCAVRTFGGSFSAEHGIGPKNQRDYDRYTPDVLKTLADRLGAALELHPAGAARFGHKTGHAEDEP